MQHADAPSSGSAVSAAELRKQMDESRELLRQVHEAVVAGRTSGRMQAVTALILSLATLMSTWCGYQAAQWSSLQSGLQSRADTAERQAAGDTLAGLQIRTQDGLILLEYWRLLRAGDQSSAATLESKMKPVLRSAVSASIRDGILSNPSVVGPLHRPEYRLDVEVEAAARREDAGKLSAQAAAAGQVSNEYVLLTLMMASVLFVGGVSTTFSRKRVRRVLSVIALVAFAISMISAVRLDVLWPKIGGKASTTSSAASETP
jgi:hypothetical protein